MYRLPIALCLALASPGCAKFHVDTHAVLVDADKTLIVTDKLYHVATVASAAAVESGKLTPAQIDQLGKASDKAATALHTAKRVRTSAAVALAINLVETFSTLAGVK